MALEDFGALYGGFEFGFPEIAGRYQGKKLVICGDAACVWSDLEKFNCRDASERGCVRLTGWDFMTINKVVETFPGHIEHAYSNEPNNLQAYIAARRPEYRKEFPNPQHVHSCNRGVTWRWPWRGHGSSALGACLTGIVLGYEKIVLAGVPLDDSPHNGEPPWRKCRFKSSEVQSTKELGTINHHWKSARDLVFDGKIKSLSGRTRDWLGQP